MKLIIAGYSYGSLITTFLPPIEDILQRFARVNKGTAEAEVHIFGVQNPSSDLDIEPSDMSREYSLLRIVPWLENFS